MLKKEVEVGPDQESLVDINIRENHGDFIFAMLCGGLLAAMGVVFIAMGVSDTTKRYETEDKLYKAERALADVQQQLTESQLAYQKLDKDFTFWLSSSNSAIYIDAKGHDK